MKKILTVLAVVLFTISASAQETKPAAKEKEEKNSCVKHDSHAKKMTEEDIANCIAKCKSEGKKCTAEDMSKCKKENKKCSPEEMDKSKAKGKKCCARKE